MKHRRLSSTMLLLVILFFISLLFLTNVAPHNHDQLLAIPRLEIEGMISFSAWPIFSDNTYDRALTVLNQSTRIDIYNFIKDNPGLHFRALSSCLSLPIGVLQYHLGLLIHNGLVTSYHMGKYRTYFESRKFTELEMKIISILRNGTSGKILVALLDKPQIEHKDLAALLGISSQALSWQMNHLKDLGLIRRSVEELKVKYSIKEKNFAAVNQYATFCRN